MDAGTIGPARRVLDRGISHYFGDRPLRMVPLSAERRSGIAWRARRQPAGAKFLAGQHCRKTGLAITVPGASGVSQLLVNNLRTLPERDALLQRTLEQHQAQGLVVLGVDQGEEISAITQFGKSYELAYPLLADTHLAVNHKYGVTGLPVSYFIDGKGAIRTIVNGVLQTNTLQDGLASIGIK